LAKAGQAKSKLSSITIKGTNRRGWVLRHSWVDLLGEKNRGDSIVKLLFLSLD
jgi:hypothetical protein